MHTQYPFRAGAGFNMMEVLVALGIFALGFTTIAALFPAGALLQRRTADDISSRHVERSARAVIKATELSAAPGGELDFYTIGDTQLEPFPTDSTATPAPPPYLDEVWSLDTRSYPAAIVDPELRDFYWLPLVREDSGSGGDWQMIVFVLKRRIDASYTDKDYGPSDDSIPGIRRVVVTGVSDTDGNGQPDTFNLNGYIEARSNDYVVASDGAIYRVAEMPDPSNAVQVRGGISGNPDGLWYAPPADDGNDTSDRSDISPAHRVFNVSPTIVTGP